MIACSCTSTRYYIQGYPYVKPWLGADLDTKTGLEQKLVPKPFFPGENDDFYVLFEGYCCGNYGKRGSPGFLWHYSADEY